MVTQSVLDDDKMKSPCSRQVSQRDYFSVIGKKIILARAVVLVHVVVFGVPESEFVSLF